MAALLTVLVASPLGVLTARSASAAPSSVTSPSASRIVTVAPTRVLDTRAGLGAAGPVRPDVPVVLDLTVAGVPAGATAVVLNVTAVGSAGAGFVAVRPAGAVDAATSSLNVERAGQVIANLVTSALSPDGRVALRASMPTHLVADLAAYYLPSGATDRGRFVPVAPTRVADSRSGLGVIGPLAEGATATVGLGAAVPASATGVVLTVTVTEAAGAGYWTVWPSGGRRPTASNLNVERSGQTIANQVVVGVGAGAVDVYAQRGGHVVVDVVGWFTGDGAPVTTDGLYVPLVPRRLTDTRNGLRPLAGGRVDVALGADVPAASSITATVTLTEAGGPGHVTAHAAGTAVPATSSLNAVAAGQTIAGHVTVPVSSGGLSLSTSVGTQIVVDLTGYHLGPPVPTAPTGTSAPPSVPTRPVPDGPGDAGQFAFLHRRAGWALPARWDPCRPVRIGVHLGTGGPAFALAELQAALAQVTWWTGLELRVVGEVPQYRSDDPASVPAGVDAVVQFESFAASPDVAGHAAAVGLGGGAALWGPSGQAGRIVFGIVRVNTDHPLVPGFGRTGLRQVLLHELGHLAGLDHVPAADQVMYPTTQTRPIVGYGAGDQTGLLGLGAWQGCVDWAGTRLAASAEGSGTASPPGAELVVRFCSLP
jgi:hypothetical protein